MRDRLIEILSKPIYPKVGVDPAEVVADYLLDNGVIVPPVRVGQKVYRVNYYLGNYCEFTVRAIYFTEDKKYYPKPHIIVQHELSQGRTRINFADIGKTVFLTREEAEKALAERSGE